MLKSHGLLVAALTFGAEWTCSGHDVDSDDIPNRPNHIWYLYQVLRWAKFLYDRGKCPLRVVFDDLPNPIYGNIYIYFVIYTVYLLIYL